jgi:hypothetical protein
MNQLGETYSESKAFKMVRKVNFPQGLLKRFEPYGLGHLQYNELAKQ